MHACVNPFSNSHEELPDRVLETRCYHIVTPNKEGGRLCECKIVTSWWKFIARMRKENGRKSRKRVLGFGFRDRQNPWLNFYFAFVEKLVPDYEV